MELVAQLQTPLQWLLFIVMFIMTLLGALGIAGIVFALADGDLLILFLTVVYTVCIVGAWCALLFMAGPAVGWT